MSFELIIIGAGSAGLAAGIQAGRLGLKTKIIGESFASRLSKAGLIENLPGFPEGLQSLEYIEKLKKHLKQVKVELEENTITEIKKEEDIFLLKNNDGEIIQTKTIIISTGGKEKKLNVEGEDKFYQKGISYCAVCDAALFRGKKTAVIGNGNTAAKGVIQVGLNAREIYWIIPDDKPIADKIYLEQMKILRNLVTIYNAKVTRFFGEGVLKGLEYVDGENNSHTLKVKGAFIELGIIPNNELAKQVGVALNPDGTIRVDFKTMATNIDGIFAAGEVVNFPPNILTSMAEGYLAATSAHDYLKNMKK